MVRNFLIWLLTCICITTYCEGQGIAENDVGPDKTYGNLILTADEDCFVSIDKAKDFWLKSGSTKKISLRLGTHTLRAVNNEFAVELTSNLNIKKEATKFPINLKSLITTKKKETKISKIGNTQNDTVKIIVVPPKPKADIKARVSPESVIVNDLLDNMALIPGDEFLMGVPGGKIKDLLPHTVTIKSIKFGKYEVTQKHWEMIMGPQNNHSSNKGCSNCPVENVSWNEVDSFILKLNSFSNKKFRLPSEAEWEYVAKKALQKEIENSGAAFKTVEDLVEQTAWYNKNSGGKTHPSGSKKPLMGIYDLLGNVAEFCLDYYRPDYQKDTGNNPQGPSTGKEKLVKGGSYTDMDNLKPSVRNKEIPSMRKSTIGFRLVMEAN